MTHEYERLVLIYSRHVFDEYGNHTIQQAVLSDMPNIIEVAGNIERAKQYLLNGEPIFEYQEGLSATFSDEKPNQREG